MITIGPFDHRRRRREPGSLRERWGDHRQLVRFLSNPAVILAIAWLVLVIVCAIFAPWIAPHDPNAQNLEQASAGISASHWLGTDDLGRDVLSRLIWGARGSLQVTFETVALALVLALVIGLVAGFRGGKVDYVLMRATDAGLAFPPLVLALAVVAVLGSSINDTALALAIVFAPGFARFIRGRPSPSGRSHSSRRRRRSARPRCASSSCGCSPTC